MVRSRAAVLAVVIWASAASAWPAEIAATVGAIKGKAQIQTGADWAPLAVGQTIRAGDTISTGFRSEMQLKIGPSTVTVKALSRLTLKSLVQDGKTLQTDLYLKVGKVDAEVNKSDEVQSQKFEVSSPIATASVRGTAFSFDGVNLQVTRGLVDFGDLRGNVVSIPIGESARAAPPGSSQGIATNQTLVIQSSVIPAQAGSPSGDQEEASLSWTGGDYSDLLQALYGYDWFGGDLVTSLYVEGIEPLPLPAFSHITVGGVTPLTLPSMVHLGLGGISTLDLPVFARITVGGIVP